MGEALIGIVLTTVIIKQSSLKSLLSIGEVPTKNQLWTGAEQMSGTQINSEKDPVGKKFLKLLGSISAGHLLSTSSEGHRR